MAIDLHGWMFWLASSLCFACSLILGHLCAKYRARARVLSGKLSQARSALKRTRAQLHSRIERQKLTLRAGSDVIFHWNAKSGLLRWSANSGRLFSVPPRPSNAWRLLQRCVDKRDRERVQHELQLFLAGGEAVWESEFTLKGRGKTPLPVRVRGILVRDAAGKPLKMVGALRDMTDARAAKDAARALARAARLATIGEITAGITHEVNQPLGAILNNAETGLFLLQRRRPSIGMLRTILEDIRKDDLRAGEVVRRTRALLQAREMVREQVSLNKVLAEAVDLLWLQARHRGIELRLSQGAIPPISGDAVHLQQVIINLVGNALDATEVDITGSKRVEVSSEFLDGSIRVSVRDTGCGIAPEHLEEIFESFHSGKAEGLGLGLSIARAIVKAHGGHIYARNNQHGPGATVSFELPVPVEASTAPFASSTLLVRQAAD